MKKIIILLFSFVGLWFLCISVNIFAYNSSYSGTSDEIYYFADSRPLLTDDDFNVYFKTSTYSVFYDIPYYVDDNTLDDLYQNNYFDGFEENTIIIFEIKTRLIDASILNNIFYQLKSDGAYIIFVSGFSDSLYSDDIHLYIDDYIECLEHITFEEYVRMAVMDIISRKTNDSIVILVDSRYCDDINNYQNSKYVQLILDELCLQLNLNSSIGNYDDIIGELLDNKLVYFIVNTSANNYELLDINYRGYTSTMTSLNELNNFVKYGINSLSSDIYAMGILNLTKDYYNLLLNCDKNGYTIPTYVWVIDDYQNSGNGLPIITDTNLAISNGYLFNTNWEAFDNLVAAISSAISR